MRSKSAETAHLAPSTSHDANERYLITRLTLQRGQLARNVGDQVDRPRGLPRGAHNQEHVCRTSVSIRTPNRDEVHDLGVPPVDRTPTVCG